MASDSFAIDDGPLSAVGIEAIRRGDSEIPDFDAARMLVDSVAGLMVSVSTDGPDIKVVSEDYRREHRALRAVLGRLDIPYPNHFEDVWRWHGKWTDGGLPTYASRRAFVAELFAPVRAGINDASASSHELVDGIKAGPTGWDEIDGKMFRLRELFREASDPDGYNGVGLQCLSVLRVIADQVFDPALDVSDGEAVPGRDDTKARIRLYLRRVAAGRRHEHVCKLVEAAYGQANTAKHRRTATRLDAGIAANSTVLIASTLRLFDEAEVASS